MTGWKEECGKAGRSQVETERQTDRRTDSELSQGLSRALMVACRYQTLLHVTLEPS